MRNRKPRHPRRLRLEYLEARLTMSGEPNDWEDSVPWSDAASLTVSFAPDGTRIGDHTSALFAALGSADPHPWQSAILDAFQAWARQSQINAGLVADDGSPFGTPAVGHGDERFGDVRIGAVPMSSDEMAVAIPHDRQSAGSWAGDILFNSEAHFQSVDEVFAVAMHEFGHVLGLGHNTDTQSPMYASLGATRMAPTNADLASLRALYGERQPDVHEGSDGNDSLARAAHIRYSDEVEAGEPLYDGSTPLVVYADIGGATDRDIFRLENLLGYTGPISIQLRTDGFSQLAPQLTWYSGAGDNLLQGAAASGGNVTLHLDAATEGEYLFQINGPSSGLDDTGTYALVITFDARLQISPDHIRDIVTRAQRINGFDEQGMDEADLRRMFQQSSGLPIFEDDQHQDDSLPSGRDLQPRIVTDQFVRFRVTSSLSDTIDADSYRVKSPSLPSSNTHVLLVSLQSLEADGLIANVDVFDDSGNTISMTVLVNGIGHFVAQATGLESNRRFQIRVNRQGSDVFAVGNYQLEASFSQTALAPANFAAGLLSASQSQQDHVLYVARSQLFSLALQSTGDPSDIIWATIYDSQQHPVHVIAGPAGATRSGAGVLLDPGEYTVQIAAQGLAINETVTYALIGDRLTDPIGPPVTDPTTKPIYVCPDTSSVYCYPGSPPTTDPVLVVPSPVFKTPLPTTVVTPPPDVWYWKLDFLTTNPTNSLDVSNDFAVSPLDALLIINDLNSNGSRVVPPPPIQTGYLDASADGFISPLDALLVINYLNRNPQLSGAQGEAGAAIASLAAANSGRKGVRTLYGR